MSTEDELRERMKRGESSLIERKAQGVSSENVRATIIAFANSVPEGETGVLFIGVASDGTVTGITNSDERQRNVRAQAAACYPPITVEPREVYEPGVPNPVLAIEVPFSPNSPHFAGPAYVRVGSETVRATPQVFEDLIARRISLPRRLLDARDRGELLTLKIPERPGEYLSGCTVNEVTALYADFKTGTPFRGYYSYPLKVISLSRARFNETLLVTVPKGWDR